MSNAKLCRECAFYGAPRRNLCWHPACISPRGDQPGPKEPADALMCRNTGPCGPAGKFYEKREASVTPMPMKIHTRSHGPE